MRNFCRDYHTTCAHCSRSYRIGAAVGPNSATAACSAAGPESTANSNSEPATESESAAGAPAAAESAA